MRPRILFLLISCIVAIFWLGFLISLILDIIVFIQLLSGISNLYAGITILGIVNSFVDLFVDTALASIGLEIMALTGVLVGQMFNYLVGFGIGSIVKYFY